jgi:hypothetical protein
MGLRDRGWVAGGEARIRFADLLPSTAITWHKPVLWLRLVAKIVECSLGLAPSLIFCKMTWLEPTPGAPSNAYVALCITTQQSA